MNNQSDGRERIQEQIEQVFQSLADSLKPSLPNLWWRSFHYHNDAFPLSSTLTFALGSAEEVAVLDTALMIDVSVSCQVVDNCAHFSADVSRGDGMILADGPTLNITPYEEETFFNDQTVIEFVKQLGAKFIMKQKPLIFEELKRCVPVSR